MGAGADRVAVFGKALGLQGVSRNNYSETVTFLLSSVIVCTVINIALLASLSEEELKVEVSLQHFALKLQHLDVSLPYR